MNEIVRLIFMTNCWIAAFLTGGIIDSILREANSKAAIEKICTTAPKWKRFAKLCYWNTTCCRPNMLRFFILLRVAVYTISLYSLFPLRYEGFALDMAAWLLFVTSATNVFDMIYFRFVLK